MVDSAGSDVGAVAVPPGSDGNSPLLAERLQQTHESEDVVTVTAQDPSRQSVEIQSRVARA